MSLTTHYNFPVFTDLETETIDYRDWSKAVNAKDGTSAISMIDEAIHEVASDKDVLEGTVNEALTEFTLTGETTPCTPEAGKVYVDTAQNITYRWTGSVFVPIGSDIELGESADTAFRGDYGKVAYDHVTDTDPHAYMGWLRGVDEEVGSTVPTNSDLLQGYTAAQLTPKISSVTLTAAGWSNNQQTVTVSGVLADEMAQLIEWTPSATYVSVCSQVGISCVEQSLDGLLFSCSTTPTVDITILVSIQDTAT